MFLECIASRLSDFLDGVDQFDEMSQFEGSLPRLLKKMTENLQENQNSQQIETFSDVIQQFIKHNIFDMKSLFFPNTSELSAFYYITNNDILALFLVKACQLLENCEDIIQQVVLLIEKYLCFHQVDLEALMFLKNLLSMCETRGFSMHDLRDKFGFNLLTRMLLTEQTRSCDLSEMAVKNDLFPEKILSEKSLAEFSVESDLSKMKRKLILSVKLNEQEQFVAAGDLNFRYKTVPRNTSVIMLAGRISCWNLVASILDLNPQKYPTLLASKSNTIHPLFENDSSGETIFFMALEDNDESDKYNICEKLVKVVDGFTLINAHVVGDETAIEYLYRKLGPKPNSLIQMIENKCKEKKDEISEEESKDPLGKILSGKSCGFTFDSLDGKKWSCKCCDIAVTTDEGFVISDKSHYLR